MSPLLAILAALAATTVLCAVGAPRLWLCGIAALVLPPAAAFAVSLLGALAGNYALFAACRTRTARRVVDRIARGRLSPLGRPLRLRVFPEREIPEDTFKKQSELDSVREAIAQMIPAGTPLDDWDAFAKATKLKKTQLKKIRPFITETDPHAKEVEGESDPNLRDSENIPFNYDGGIDAFIEKEVKPYAPDAYVDESKTKIGYEISFTKYFYKPVKLRDMKDILTSLAELEKESDGVMDEIVEGLQNE